MSTTALSENTAGLLLSFMDTIRGDISAGLSDASSFMHIKALDFIAKKQGLSLYGPSMSEIASYLKITSPGATMIVDKLVENKELDRHADADDRRVVRLKITSHGRSTLESGMTIIKDRIASRLASLGKSEQKDLAAMLTKLITKN